jgi:hypothetical protein
LKTCSSRATDKLKEKQLSPDIYKIIYRLSRWKTKSERFFSAFSATEAFKDFYYAFVSGHVDSKSVKIYRIEYYDRFANKWFNKIGQVVLDRKLELVQEKGGYIFLKR